MNDTDFIAPLELPYSDGATQLTIRPAGVAQLVQLMRVARPLVDELMALPEDMIGRLEAGAPTGADLAYLLELVTERGELAIELVAIGSGMAIANVALLLPDRFAYLFALVVQANADFFSRAAPGIKATGARVAAAWAQGAQKPGPTPSTA